MRRSWPRPAAIIIGSDEIGSAIAVAFDRLGYAVVVCDEVDPPWSRRGMAFTDAWYYGNANLDGATAVFCATVKSIPAVLDRPGLIAATTWSWGGAAAALPTALIVAATPGTRRPAIDLRARIERGVRTVGIGAHYAKGRNVDIAIECSDPVTPDDATTVASKVHRVDVRAPLPGRFATACRIGDRVREGQVLGVIGSAPIAAPRSGVLIGLSARGAAMRPGDVVIEVDPLDDPERCFGLDARGAMVADAVVAALAADANIDVRAAPMITTP
jgi:xanthine dehydrogenase accessory factor